MWLYSFIINIMTETEKYLEMFEYLSTPDEPVESAGLLVFGRKDALVAHAAGKAVLQGLGEFVVISGGIGKDSGDLAVPEAVYLHHELLAAYPELPVEVFTETAATNGGENVRNSLALMDEHRLEYRHALTSVAHATSARRLTEMMRHEAIQRGTPIETVAGIATDYQFDPEYPADQQEAAAELLRLHRWPAKNWLQSQPDLPQNLVDFAEDKHG